MSLRNRIACLQNRRRVRKLYTSAVLSMTLRSFCKWYLFTCVVIIYVSSFEAEVNWHSFLCVTNGCVVDKNI